MRKLFRTACTLSFLALSPRTVFGQIESQHAEAGSSSRPNTLLPQKSERDPTKPSEQMLERIRTSIRGPAVSEPVAKVPTKESTVSAPAAMPHFHLRAIVMSDADHGSVILKVDDKSITLKLDREQIQRFQDNLPPSQSGFTVGGVFYAIEDFTEHSILLKRIPDNVMMVVQ